MKAKVIQAINGTVPLGVDKSVSIEEALNDFLTGGSPRAPKVTHMSQSDCAIVGWNRTTITLLYE